MQGIITVILDYFHRLFKRALLSTFRFMGWEKGKMKPVARAVLSGLMSIAIFYWLGESQAMETKFRIAKSVIEGTGALFIVVFLWNLLLAPVWFDKEQQEKIVILEKKISDAKITDEKNARLMEYRGRFISEIFAHPINALNFDERVHIFNQIQEATLNYMTYNGYSARDIGLLRHLGNIGMSVGVVSQLQNMAITAANKIEEITGRNYG